NLYATTAGPQGAPSLMVSAHSDEIGAIVRSIEPSGLIRLAPVGGFLDKLAAARHVRVRGRRGVIGVKSGHLQSPEERGRVTPMRDLYVDLGFSSADEVRALGIRVGDQITYDEPMVELANPDRVAGKALDNRIGCAVLVTLARRLQGAALPCTLHLVVAVQEEVGLRGARVAAHRLNPTAAIVVDTAPAGGTPDVDYFKDLNMLIGGGPVLTLMSRGGSGGYIASPALRDFVRGVAERQGITLQEAIFLGGNSDAASVHLEQDGIPTVAVNLARRYSHSPVEMLDINDACGAVALLEAAVRAFGPEVDLGFLKAEWG
ncbi:MAG TPA: M20/M25/M40 family metallo-hydrolase, partial [Nitrolancea sp.]|nr:M20/M25/M40 family metallo-hydrolase [Nitrolancea sp.]